MTVHAGRDVWLEVLVEEPSAERALNVLIPAIVPGVQFNVRSYQGKKDLLRKLPNRLCGYAHFPESMRLAVLVDLDRDECIMLKAHLEELAATVGLPTLRSASGQEGPRVATRIAVEELEAWFFGDISALAKAFPGVPRTLGSRAGFRDPDAIADTWEHLERVLQSAGHHRSGLRKLEAAARISTHMDVEVNRSASFCHFRDGLRRLVGVEAAA